MKMFSDNYKIFKNIALSFPVMKEDFLTIKNGEVVTPEPLEELLTIGVVSDLNKDGSVNILVRNIRKDSNGFNRDIEFWEDTLSKLKQ